MYVARVELRNARIGMSPTDRNKDLEYPETGRCFEYDAGSNRRLESVHNEELYNLVGHQIKNE
jgi:hypothetical protein